MRHWRRVKVEETASVVKEIGAQNFILATDLGQMGNPSPADGLQLFVTDLMKAGLGKDIPAINPKASGGLELPLKVVQARMGHAGIQITADRYGHLFPRGNDSAELQTAERAFMAVP